MKIIRKLSNVISSRDLFHVIKIVCVMTVIVGILFLSLNIFFYLTTRSSSEEVPLYYDFKPNTIKYDKDYKYDGENDDISEMFLSYAVSYGVDVSEWQGVIDWEKVRRTGISFAMIRCGFRQTVGNEVHEDDKFRQNIEGATKAGLKVGVYFFGTARTEAEAIEEANFTVDLIKDYKLTLPVVYDIETFNEGRLQNVNLSKITDNILAYTETVGSYGYETMVYSYHDAFAYMLDTGRLDGKLIWLAHWVENTSYRGNYHMWQYTDSGRVDGIKTNVDLNVSYIEYVDNEKEIVANPRYVKEPEIVMTEVNEQVKTKNNATYRNNPTTSMPNKLGTIPKKTVMQRTGINEKFSRVIYNGRVVYVSNDDLSIVK